MKFIRSLLARNEDEQFEFGRSEPASKPAIKDMVQTPLESVAKMRSGDQNVMHISPDAASDDILNKVNAEVSPDTPAAAAAPVNIWDMEGEDATPEPLIKTRRRRNNKTRLLGYEHLEDDAVTTFDKAEKVVPTARAMFPVGWVVVAEGPGRGTCFTLEAGMSQIGRGEDQAIQLDFGDNSISRTNHAAIVYDTETHDFLLGHGGKKNIVRLNGKPVISNETLVSGDEVVIGETKLRFTALCTADFNWADEDASEEEIENVAIA